MLDFLKIKEKTKNGITEIIPDFKNGRINDLMVRSGKFYAIWDEENNVWSKDELDVQRIVDKELWEYVKKRGYSQGFVVNTMEDYSTGSWSDYKKYLREHPDSYVKLDRKVTFSNSVTSKKDHVSKHVDYPLEEAPCEAYERIISTLYSPEERAKIEWAIGSIVAGDSIDIQKFFVFYGKPGSGKSTILHIIEKLFKGYCTSFKSKNLGSSSSQFSTEPFKDGPLVAIEHDGNLSKIEDNATLNSVISHENILINVKNQSQFTDRVDCLLFMGTNKEVKITDAMSGILRRLIDIRPTGKTIPVEEFRVLEKQTKFELSGIAWHCLKVYEEMGKDYYISYKPFEMLYKSNAFYNFVENNYFIFKENDSVTLKAAWEMYNTYFKEAALQYKMPMYIFREELKNYFENFEEITRVNGKQVRSYYSHFKESEFNHHSTEKDEMAKEVSWIKLAEQESRLDILLKDCKAQYATEDEKPTKKWQYVRKTLKDIDTKKVHYVKVPENHIVIDFDIKGKDGNKDMAKNLEAASKFPKTYAELSKSGGGIHLHYIYTGDVEELSHVYSKDIEVKIFTGGSSLRRKLTKCNDISVAQLSSGLPKKETKKVLNIRAVRNEQQLRDTISKCLNKEYESMPSTTQNINFIAHLLEESYEDLTLSYDIRDMEKSVRDFAQKSSHQADKCFKTYQKMHFCSHDIEEKEKRFESILDNEPDDRPIAFFDIEVFPNLFIFAYKVQDKEKPVFMINPTQNEIIEVVTSYRLIGFNNNRYDDHIVYGRIIGENNQQSFDRSQRLIVHSDRTAYFARANEVSYADAYGMSSKKQSLKKWELELHLPHKEIDIPWDSEVPEDRWVEVAEYCMNDVCATEAVFYHIKPDWTALQILADLAGLSVNHSINTLTKTIIVGDDPNPQSSYIYTDLSTIFPGYEFNEFGIDKNRYLKDENGKPIFKTGKSIYLGIDPSEGGYVYAEPGYYENVDVFDIMSMHPTSAIQLEIFGKYTKNFEGLYEARIAIKHKEFDKARKMFGGKLAKYLVDESKADELAYALKIAINSVYGLTSAKFNNPLKDPRNVDNIVAKRGSLFMISLQKYMQEKGYKVIHIKTDSIKIPNSNETVRKLVMDYGKKYGYSFEHESRYEKMCLVNDAVYIAKYSKDIDINGEKHAGKWTATGAQFQHPYVFKYLFTKEPIEFNDMCEIKTVQTSLYLDMNEDLPEGEHKYVFVGKAGSFCPVKPGCRGGILLRKQNDKYNSASGAKGFRWMESDMVEHLARINNYDVFRDIDERYFRKLTDAAIDTINKYCNFYEFANDEVDYKIDITSDELPF